MEQTRTAESIANRVRGHAARLGIDMTELARRTGATEARVRELEGNAMPTVCEVARVEMALGLQPGELFCDA